MQKKSYAVLALALISGCAAGGNKGSSSSASSAGSTGSTGGVRALCASCSANSQCLSGYCDRGTHQCNSASPCGMDPSVCTRASLTCDTASGNCACAIGTSGSSGTSVGSSSGSTAGTGSGSSGSTGTSGGSTGSTGSSSASNSASSSASSSTGGQGNGAFSVTGDGQSAFQDQALASPVVLQFAIDGGPVPGVVLTITPPPGAVAIPPMVVTDFNGRASVGLRLGRSAGLQTFTVSAVDGGVGTISATAAPVDAGVVYTLVNVDRGSADDALPLAGTLARVGTVNDVAVASDGTIYFTDSTSCRVRKLAPSGLLTNLAGTGSCSTTQNNGGPALQASFFYPEGLALDEPGNLLYVADSQNNVIRVIDLQTGNVDLFAGGGNAPSPGYGDSNPASAAVFARPSRLVLHKEGTIPYLYVTDLGHGRVRRINLNTLLVEAFFTPSPGVNGAADSTCGGSSAAGCALAFAPSGELFISMYSGNTSGQFPSVVRRAADGTVTVVAGAINGSTADGVPASTAALASPPALAFDPAGNLYLADFTDNRVRRIDSTTGRIRTVLGTGTAGALGDYGLAIAAQISSPWTLAFDPAGGLVVSEQGNHGLRAVAGVSASVPVAATLAIVAGNPQTAELDQNPGLLFTVKLTDENAVPLANYGIAWTASDPGSALYITSSRTNPSGKATALGRVGLAPGPYRFQASMTDLFGRYIPGSPVTFTVTAVSPALGTTFTIVNTDHSPGDDPGPIAGISGHVGELRGMTRASDGTIYFTDFSHSRVRKLSPQGELTTVAGDGTQGYTGDNGPAARARLSGPQGIVLDEPAMQLYVSDSNNNVIRLIDLSVAVPTITTFAGTGSTTPLGNGGPAAAANFSLPTHLYLRTEGTTPYLYVADFNHGAIRRINRNTTIVTNYFDASTLPSGNGKVTWNGCGYGVDGCSIAWDSSGVPFISGHYFDGTFYNPQGVARIDFTTVPATATIILGTSDQTSPKYLFEPPALLFNAQNQLLVTDRGASKLNKFDEAGNLLATLAGTGTAGYAGDSVPLSQTQLNHPWMTLLTPEGHILIEDGVNACIRESY